MPWRSCSCAANCRCPRALQAPLIKPRKDGMTPWLIMAINPGTGRDRKARKIGLRVGAMRHVGRCSSLCSSPTSGDVSWTSPSPAIVRAEAGAADPPWQAPHSVRSAGRSGTSCLGRRALASEGLPVALVKDGPKLLRPHRVLAVSGSALNQRSSDAESVLSPRSVPGVAVEQAPARGPRRRVQSGAVPNPWLPLSPTSRRPRGEPNQRGFGPCPSSSLTVSPHFFTPPCPAQAAAATFSVSPA